MSLKAPTESSRFTNPYCLLLKRDEPGLLSASLAHAHATLATGDRWLAVLPTAVARETCRVQLMTKRAYRNGSLPSHGKLIQILPALRRKTFESLKDVHGGVQLLLVGLAP